MSADLEAFHGELMLFRIVVQGEIDFADAVFLDAACYMNARLHSNNHQPISPTFTQKASYNTSFST